MGLHPEKILAFTVRHEQAIRAIGAGILAAAGTLILESFIPIGRVTQLVLLLLFGVAVYFTNWWGTRLLELWRSKEIRGNRAMPAAAMLLILGVILGAAGMRARLSPLLPELIPIDTSEQAEAREQLDQFARALLLETHSALLELAHTVSITLAQGNLPESTKRVGGILDEYADLTVRDARGPLLAALDGRDQVSFRELELRVADYYRAYTDLAMWTQEGVEAIDDDPNNDLTNDTIYVRWNDADEAFLSGFRSLVSLRQFEWLYGQVDSYGSAVGSWNVFRLRDENP